MRNVTKKLFMVGPKIAVGQDTQNKDFILGGLMFENIYRTYCTYRQTHRQRRIPGIQRIGQKNFIIHLGEYMLGRQADRQTDRQTG